MDIGEKIGPFTVEKVLGNGAMGTVYKAIYEREEDGRQGYVALKVVSFGLQGNESAMARFYRESAILKQLRHPHIVRLIATGKYKRTPFIAMEYVDGKALDRLLQERGRLGWEDVVGYGKQLCEALQHAHDKGIIHRDLKPSNLMLTKDGRLKLTDFGIAKDDDVTALTAANNTIGTAAYMSPEQCQGKPLNNRSDLYSLGVVFYELLTGKKPFVAETTMDLFLKHVNDKPVRPAKLVPDLPVWVDNLVMFLLEKDRDQRPVDASTVGKMLADIEQKVAAGVSAGEAVAKSRKIDRKLGDQPLTDADKTAARALQGKKKKKKPGRPWYEAGWVKAVPLVLALAGIAGGVAWYFWPEGMEPRLKRLESASGEGKLEAVRDFLAGYRGSTEPKLDPVRKQYQELVARQKEQVLLKRLGGKLIKEDNSEGFDPEVYPDAIAALKAERAGKLDDATKLWADVQKKSAGDATRLPDDAEEQKGVLGWIAAGHLADLRERLPATEKKLREQLASDRTFEKSPKSDGPEGVATRAVLFEEYQDAARAKTAWQALFDQCEKDADKRVWALWAAQRAAALGDTKDEPEARAGRLAKTLAGREAELANDPTDGALQRKLRNAAREIVFLYGGEANEAVKAVVDKARPLEKQPKGSVG